MLQNQERVREEKEWESYFILSIIYGSALIYETERIMSLRSLYKHLSTLKGFAELAQNLFSQMGSEPRQDFCKGGWNMVFRHTFVKVHNFVSQM